MHVYVYEQATLLSQRKTDKEDIHHNINNLIHFHKFDCSLSLHFRLPYCGIKWVWFYTLVKTTVFASLGAQIIVKTTVFASL